MMRVVEYLTRNGQSPFAKWFDDIDVQAAVKIRRAIARMEVGNFGDSKSIGKGVTEYRLTYGPGYRIYCGRDGDNLVILLVGGTKRRQQNDIARAHEYWVDYKDRMDQENASDT